MKIAKLMLEHASTPVIKKGEGSGTEREKERDRDREREGEMQGRRSGTSSHLIASASLSIRSFTPDSFCEFRV